MSNIPTIESKYHLKSVHAEIDLYDRRLAHLYKYDVFETEAARAAAARKLTLKRDPLVATAKRLVAEGVEYKESELPRSFRPEGVPAPVEAKPEPAPAPAAAPPAARVRPTPAPLSIGRRASSTTCRIRQPKPSVVSSADERGLSL
jgi:hypothetical protein